MSQTIHLGAQTFCFPGALAFAIKWQPTWLLPSSHPSIRSHTEPNCREKPQLLRHTPFQNTLLTTIGSPLAGVGICINHWRHGPTGGPKTQLPNDNSNGRNGSLNKYWHIDVLTGGGKWLTDWRTGRTTGMDRQQLAGCAFPVNERWVREREVYSLRGSGNWYYNSYCKQYS